MPIYRKTRLERRGDVLERLLAAELGPRLAANGFAEKQPFSFHRRWESGQDTVFLNLEPRWFSINICSTPDAMIEINELFHDDEDARLDIELGLTCDFILTPAGVFGTDRTDCTFKTRNAGERNKSVGRARRAFDDHLGGWFDRIHDPRVFVAAIQPNALMHYGRAHELAGNTELAREAYAAMFARLSAMIEYAGTLRKFAAQRVGAGVRLSV